MPSQLATILRKSTRSNEEPLNILTSSTHERYETHLCQTKHNFYSLIGKTTKKWNTTYAPVPSNYCIFDQGQGVLPHLNLDLVLIQNVGSQMSLLQPIAETLQIPLLVLHHTFPPPQANKFILLQQKHALQNIEKTIFISDVSRKAWGYSEEDGVVIEHGIDSEFWCPDAKYIRQPITLSVCNDWMNRDWCCGFRLWTHITQQEPKLPVCVVGDTPGLSKPAKSLEELRTIYQQSLVFLNTSLVSPIPCALLEAALCECAIVTTNTGLIPSLIQHGTNGLLYSPNEPQQARQHIIDLINNPEQAKILGQNARKSVVQRFGLDRFIKEWDSLFREVV